ncbi:TPA: DNA cytosine methyltransferase [Pseudomonas aeruginosa]|uniref:DNA cytosine methyltransferase n=3 Tax=Pseudomonas aeruginosa TaxID=287 RepID=UPI000859554E|nr:DNA cytosine methyltransferase [Pseudomonas aeruginosa]MCT4805231.1 DNA cytosine methyltransferase [Pseudomonas aeruginosa]MCT4890438.1 DNA cytosine methyltransferase [Pseudomonas aeruginosa]MCT5104918.1 DNA cytosine methyltransferase [Pseudomonas aeruginosa]MCT5349414.1 DNA cytosine methyltransferase [Pseudomonas aeruginosa]MCT5609266.1 DNA cytosine methyltransferase [Pseudomonas aeruginosa]
MNWHITYGSVCSGIEAASVAWHGLGFRASWFAEIEPFPSAVLAHRWPAVPNLGDMTKLAREVLLRIIAAPLILVGGTPCQDFSVAGMRAGLAGERGALTMKFVELADAIDHVRPDGDECVVVWENVPGVLSDKGNAFGNFLAALVGESEALEPSGPRWTNAGCVYGPRRAAAWRVLDAQYFGLAQRRKRVFVVASARAGFDPCEVLFEREGMRRDHPPRRGEGQDLAGHAPFGPALQCGCGYLFGLNLGQWGCPNCEGDEGPAVEVLAGVPAFGGENQSGSLFQAGALTAHGARNDFASETFCVAPTLAGGGRKSGGYSLDDIPTVAGTLQANGKAAGSATQQDAEAGLLVVHGTQDPDVVQDCAHTLGRNHGQENAVFDPNQITSATNRSQPTPGLCHTLPASSQAPIAFPLLEVGKRTGRSTFDPRAGLGVGAENDPMFTLQASAQHGVCVTGDITHTLKAEGFDASEDGTGRGQPIVAATLEATAGRSRGAGTPVGMLANSGSAVRRLTPRECERLQGFPDDYTLIPWAAYQKAMRAAEASMPRTATQDEVLRARIAALYACDVSKEAADECPDGPRYKAIGNSKAVPVVRWIGRRIQQQLERTA